jgi:NhaA family Na+:H+ antiporter
MIQVAQLVDFWFYSGFMFSTQHYFSNAVGSVLFVPGSFVYLHFTGEPMGSAEVRALYVHAANLLARHSLGGILADHRAMPDAFAEEDRSWLLTHWLPNTISPPPPPVFYAVLPNSHPARRLHTDDVLHALRRYLTVGVFEDLDQAADWLRLQEGGLSAN